MDPPAAEVIRQHLIDPEICIRCNTCESTCPVGAISHDSRNYVVDADKCELCMACVPPCPTGSIDNWRAMPRARAYTTEAQFGWDTLPPELPADELGGSGAAGETAAEAPRPPAANEAGEAALRSRPSPLSPRPGRPPIPSPISMVRGRRPGRFKRQLPAMSG